MKCITLWAEWLGRVVSLGGAPPGNLQNTGHVRQVAGAQAEEPCLAALCVELAAAHFQFEELTLYRFEFFVVGVGAELL